jgi:hypothetical protein
VQHEILGIADLTKTIGVRDFVCVHGIAKIPTLLDRCNGVLKALLDANASVSSDLLDHVLHIEKPANSTTSTNVLSVAEAIRNRTSVTGIVYLSAPVFTEVGGQIFNYLNNTRSFKIANFDFHKSMMKYFDLNQLHYSTSGLIYLQTLISVLLLYIQVRCRCFCRSWSVLVEVNTNESFSVFFHEQLISLIMVNPWFKNQS